MRPSLSDEQRPPEQIASFPSKEEALLVATRLFACSSPLAGRARWTPDLLVARNRAPVVG
jgi:hypothetical protein